jgi:cystathionine beta-lyase/cystathionine gamma-synthase
MTMTVKSKNPETVVLHAGPRSDYATGAVAVPIFQTTAYESQHRACSQPVCPQGLRQHLLAHHEPHQ